MPPWIKLIHLLSENIPGKSTKSPDKPKRVFLHLVHLILILDADCRCEMRKLKLLLLTNCKMITFYWCRSNI